MACQADIPPSTGKLTPARIGPSRAIEFCPGAVLRPARWRSPDLPGDGHGICPGVGHLGFSGCQDKGFTPWPASA